LYKVFLINFFPLNNYLLLICEDYCVGRIPGEQILFSLSNVKQTQVDYTCLFSFRCSHEQVELRRNTGSQDTRIQTKILGTSEQGNRGKYFIGEYTLLDGCSWDKDNGLFLNVNWVFLWSWLLIGNRCRWLEFRREWSLCGVRC